MDGSKKITPCSLVVDRLLPVTSDSTKRSQPYGTEIFPIEQPPEQRTVEWGKKSSQPGTQLGADWVDFLYDSENADLTSGAPLDRSQCAICAAAYNT